MEMIIYVALGICLGAVLLVLIPFVLGWVFLGVILLAGLIMAPFEVLSEWLEKKGAKVEKP